MPPSPTTFRQDYVAALKTLLDEFQAAHGDRLRRTFRTRPASFVTDTPLGYVDRRPERISHAATVRERVVGPSIILVEELTDNDETLARFDTTVDLFVDHCTAYRGGHMAGGTWDRMTVEDDFEDGFWLVRFTFENLSILERRL